MVDEPNHPERTPDSAAEPPAADPAATTRIPRLDPVDPDATRQIPRGPEPADATRTMPGMGDEPPRWSARAGVPAPGTMRQHAPIWPDEVTEDPHAGRSWLTPVVIALVALLLIVAVGVGIWLISRGTDGAGPVVPPSTSPSAAGPSPSAAPSASAPPSPTAPPSSAAASPVPAEVNVPALRGDTEADARGRLEDLGLTVTVERRVDASLPVGRVLDSDPPAGTTVLVGSTVNLIVAAAAPSSAAPSRSVAPSAS
jgi:eukaryotic-like serine/threonine-protein kinase